MRGLTIDSIAQRSLVLLRADSGTASIPRGALTLAAFSFTTLFFLSQPIFPHTDLSSRKCLPFLLAYSMGACILCI